MAGIEDLIANSGRTQANWDAIPAIADAFYKGRDEQFKNRQREQFKDGVPLLADGSPDFSAISKTLFQNGNLEGGINAANVALQRDQLKAGQDIAGQMGRIEAGGGQPLVSPPSTNRSGETPVAPPLARGGTNAPTAAPAAAAPGRQGGDQPGSIVGLVSAAGIPDELAGPVIAQVSALTKTDPNVPLPPQHAQRVQQVVQAAAQRMRQPDQPQPAAPAQPAPAPAAASASPMSDVQKRIAIYTAIASNPAYPKSVQEAAKLRLESLQKSVEPTPDMKNAAASGQSLPDYQNRADENTTQREILTKSLLPRLDKSQEGASAARDEIDAIHRSREQLDAPGGIFSGTAAPTRLQLAKFGELFGIPNEKITNTEAFGSAIGSRVLSLVKSLGSGTSISNSDRIFAQEMAGGQITLNDKSIRRILDIGEQAAREKITRHNATVDKVVGANEGLKAARNSYVVEAPGAYKKASASDPLAMARDAIAKGAPRDAVIKRLQEHGVNVQGL